MKLRSIAQYGLIMAILASSSSGFAARQSIDSESASASAPAATQLSAIQSHEKDFNFDWNNYSTIAPNQAKIAATEAFISTVDHKDSLSAADRQALGKLLYKLGTFYTHVSRQPDLAIKRMELAEALLTDKQDTAWNDNHLAYAYEQKFAASGQIADKERALDFVNRVIFTFYPHKKNKEVAFAYCVKGLVLNDQKDFVQAEASYKTALRIYEKLPGGKDDQYARAKNRLANIILDQNGRDKEALAMLKQLKDYWAAKGNIQHAPYAARNLVTLGQAYLKTGNAQAARDEFNGAINIYKNVYGEDSTLLTKPYQLLAEADDKSEDIGDDANFGEKA